MTTTQQSPHRAANPKVQIYEESTTQFGVSPSGPKKKIRKITLDHLCVDVPTDAMLREIFEVFDKDGNGYIDRNEFRHTFQENFDNFGAPMSDRDVERLFSKLDAGAAHGKPNDGKLSFEEFSVLILSRYSM